MLTASFTSAICFDRTYAFSFAFFSTRYSTTYKKTLQIDARKRISKEYPLFQQATGEAERNNQEKTCISCQFKHSQTKNVGCKSIECRNPAQKQRMTEIMLSFMLWFTLFQLHMIIGAFFLFQICSHWRNWADSEQKTTVSYPIPIKLQATSKS